MKMSLGIQRADLSYRNVTMEFADNNHYKNYCKVVRINGGKIVHVSVILDDEEFYLEWWNNYLTIETIAEHYGLSVDEAKKKIDNGRKEFNLKSQ